MENRAQVLLRKMVANIYLPHTAFIKRIEEETGDIKTFTLCFKEEELRNKFTFRPGQFVLVSVFNCGEAPFSISSSPEVAGELQLSIKKAGLLTGEIHRCKEGDEICMRGPYGNGFPLDSLYGRNILFVGGGIGLAPLRSLIQYVFAKRSDFGRITVLYGARTPEDIVFKEDLKNWGKENNADVLVTVDRGDTEWKGNTGPVTNLWEKIEISPLNTKTIICGPPVMIPYVVFDLLKMGFAEEDIISTLERNMKCGVGKCSHCTLGSKFTCIDGPVFTYNEMKELHFLL
ncbi:MAG: FAD/NAD(P)-binding protein [Desulfobacteraceae bacterium]|nr:FAD/NAD(P)-binding protein [Desulfobacteraceae bacterium]